MQRGMVVCKRNIFDPCQCIYHALSAMLCDCCIVKDDSHKVMKLLLAASFQSILLMLTLLGASSCKMVGIATSVALTTYDC